VRLDLLISFRAAPWLRILQYLPVGFLIVPLTTVAYVGLPKEKTNAATGLMNFMRNIGMSVGTSAVTTLIARRSSRLRHVGLSPYLAQRQALARMYGMVIGQAQVLSYVDVYWLLCALCALMFLLSFLLAKNEVGVGGDVPIHWRKHEVERAGCELHTVPHGD
jgi:MFS transporter, DHA2 family, multidrug resistance protein